MLILECESPLEAEGDGKPLLETDSAVLANDMFTAGESTKQLCEHSILSAEEPEGSFVDTPVSSDTIFGAAGMGGLEGADEVINELGYEVVESARTPGITTNYGTDKSSCIPTVSSDSSSEDLTTSLSLAITTPLPDDDEPFSKDELFTLSLALNTPLPVDDTEFDLERALPTPDIGKEPSLEVGDDKPLFEAPLYFANVRSTDSTIPMEVIFTIWKPIRQLRQLRCRLSKVLEIAFVNTSVSQEVVFGGMGAGRFGDRLEGTENVIGGLEREDIVSACLLGIVTKNGTNKLR